MIGRVDFMNIPTALPGGVDASLPKQRGGGEFTPNEPVVWYANRCFTNVVAS